MWSYSHSWIATYKWIPESWNARIIIKGSQDSLKRFFLCTWVVTVLPAVDSDQSALSLENQQDSWHTSWSWKLLCKGTWEQQIFSNLRWITPQKFHSSFSERYIGDFYTAPLLQQTVTCNTAHANWAMLEQIADRVATQAFYGWEIV